MAYFREELGENIVSSISSESALPFIALTELYYIAAKKFGDEFAERSLHSAKNWDMPILYPNFATLISAGKLAAKYRLGIADSFIAAISSENNLILVTKDKDFLQLKNVLKVKLIN